MKGTEKGRTYIPGQAMLFGEDDEGNIILSVLLQDGSEYGLSLNKATANDILAGLLKSMDSKGWLQ